MAQTDATNRNDEQPEVAGILARFADADALVAAAARVRQAGYTKWDAHSPFPVHGIDRAMGIRPTVLPWLVLAGGLGGAAGALLLQWWTNAWDYPYLISGKPFFSLPANIPVTFEAIVLGSALAAFFGVLALNGLPQFLHPALFGRGFARATTDGFFISVEARDRKFDEYATGEFFESLDAAAIEVCHAPTTGYDFPKAIYWIGAVVVTLALLPPLMIAWYRAVPKGLPRIHPISDMDFQPKFKAQSASNLFSDGRSNRAEVPGTVARGQLAGDDALFRGKRGDAWIETIPVPVTTATMQRGRERFDIYCATCHGLTGEGAGLTAIRAAEREEPNWVPPLSLHAEPVRQQPAGQLFGSISNGIRTMPAYGPQIPVEDRWAIVLYIRALQRSQHAKLEDVPPDMRDQLR